MTAAGAHMTMSIDLRGVPEGPFDLGSHVYGRGWVWYEPGVGFHGGTDSRWRWLCRLRHWISERT